MRAFSTHLVRVLAIFRTRASHRDPRLCENFFPPALPPAWAVTLGASWSLAFDRSRELYPKRNQLPRNCSQHAYDEQSEFLHASEPCKPSKPRSLHMVFFIEKDVGIKRCHPRDYLNHE